MSLIVDIQKMPKDRAVQVLRVASVLAIGALLLMMWPLVDPTPAPVLIALSVGQAIGTVSFLAYLSVVAWDLRRKRRGSAVMGAPPSLPPSAPGSSSAPPPPPSSASDVGGKD